MFPLQQKNSSQTRRKKPLVISLICLALVVCIVGAFFVYTGIYYPAAADVWPLAEQRDVTIARERDHIALQPGNGAFSTGYIFYPGGKVQAEAYLPYLARVAEAGYFCVLLEVPFRLAILDTGAAENSIATYPGISSWGIGGHSLGGVAAASYAGKAGAEVNGLVLLAAYPSEDLSQSGLSVASITASEDTVLNWQKYNDAINYFPENTLYVTISGGNHSQFGMYGHQKGDGAASISSEEQCMQAADATTMLLASITEP